MFLHDLLIGYFSNFLYDRFHITFGLSEAKSQNLKELKTKMSDGIVKYRQELKANRHISVKTRDRLEFCSLRLLGEIPGIDIECNKLLNIWDQTMNENEMGLINDGEVSKIRFQLIELTKTVIMKVNKLKY